MWITKKSVDKIVDNTLLWITCSTLWITLVDNLWIIPLLWKVWKSRYICIGVYLYTYILEL